MRLTTNKASTSEYLNGKRQCVTLYIQDFHLRRIDWDLINLVLQTLPRSSLPFLKVFFYDALRQSFVHSVPDSACATLNWFLIFSRFNCAPSAKETLFDESRTLSPLEWCSPTDCPSKCLVSFTIKSESILVACIRH